MRVPDILSTKSLDLMRLCQELSFIANDCGSAIFRSDSDVSNLGERP